MRRGGGEGILLHLTGLDPSVRRLACRCLLAYVLSDAPTAPVTEVNPPEAWRVYSSVFRKDAAGTGHARSALDSEQAWSAARNDDQQWVVLDLGEEARILGVVLQGRRRHRQHVQRVRIELSVDGGAWEPAPGGPDFDTACQPQDEAHKRVPFAAGGAFASQVRLRPLKWEGHVSMRCGLLVGASGRALAGLPIVCLRDGSICALSVAPGRGEESLLLDLESEPASGKLVASCGAALARAPAASSLMVEDAAGDEGSVGESCARLLWPCREGLLVRPFTAADAVEMSLPSGWRGAASVSDWRRAAPAEWLRRLWAAIDRTALLDGSVADELLARLGPWPLIPCGELLVRLDRATSVLASGGSTRGGGGGGGGGLEGGGGGGGSFATEDLLACAALRAVGVALADPSYELKALASRLRPLTGGGIVAALTALSVEGGLDWGRLGAAQRASVLDLISRDAASLDEAALRDVARLPLFEFERAGDEAGDEAGEEAGEEAGDSLSSEGDSLGPSRCGALGPEGRRWLKPQFKTLAADGGFPAELLAPGGGASSRFLARIPAAAPRSVLYSRLQVQSMARADYYASVVLPRWGLLDEEAQLAQLLELQRYYEELCDERVALPDGGASSFGDLFGASPLFGGLRAAQLLDPELELHVAFFPKKLPHPSLRTERSLQWLRRCGMAQSLTRSAFSGAAETVDAAAAAAFASGQPATPELKAQARQVVDALLASFSHLRDDSQQLGQPPFDEWLRHLGSLRLAAPFTAPPRTFLESATAAEELAPAPPVAALLAFYRAAGGPADVLLPLRGNIVPRETSSTHLLSAACWSHATVLLVPNARAVPTELIAGAGAFPSATYEQLFGHLLAITSLPPATLQAWQRDQRDSWVDGRSRTGRSGSFRQQLELGCYPFLATAEPATLSRLADERIVLLENGYSPERRPLEFIAPSRVFVDLSQGAPPHAYTLRDAVFAFSRFKLHALFDCPRSPSLAQIVSWLDEMRATAGEAPLDAAQLRSAAALADLAGLRVFYEAGELPSAGLLIPDRSGRLRRAPNLLVDDAPWLDGRVDKSPSGHLPAVHPSLSSSAALRLGARRLSSAVQERPDAPLVAMAEERINEVLYAGAAGPVTLQLASWNRSLRSRAFRVSLRRAISTNRRWAHLSVASALKRQPTGADSSGRGVDELRHGRIVAVEEIRSRFEVVQSGGRAVDVTLRPRREGDVDGGDGSDSITVIDEASGAPTLYLRLGRSTAAARTAAAGTAAAPAVQRQTSSHRLLQKVLKRWRPCLATELDRYLGEGSVRDRMLLVELLDVDDPLEMPEVLNLYRVPVQSFDPSLGTRYSGAEGRPRRAGSSLEELSPLVGSRVLFPPSALPEELREEADGGEGVLLVGRLERVRAVGDALSAVVTVAGDDETCAIEPGVLLRPPTLDEGIGDARERAEQEEAAAGPRASLEGGVDARGDPSHARPPPPPEASQAGPGGEDDDDDDGSEAVARVEYRAALGWEESELAARRALAERLEARRRAAPPQPEPEGMDRVLRRCEAVELSDVDGRKVPVGKGEAAAEGASVVAAVKRTPGYDLVRVGNFGERDDGSPPDIAFFHNRPTLSQIYDEATHRRQELVKQSCGALRDVCDRVFGFDAAKVTLFYERGAASRFVRQKLLFNLAPVEQHKAAKGLADVRADPFVYCYFYGLCVHKLAHFFDVVHGTRHDFFMSEYRAHHALNWVQLLLRRGFEPAAVEREYRHLLWAVVD